MKIYLITALVTIFAFFMLNSFLEWKDVEIESEKNMNEYYMQKDDGELQSMDLLQLSLEIFHRDNGFYPKKLQEATGTTTEKYMSEYKYGTHILQQDYVLGIEMKSKNNPVLNRNDYYKYGVNCHAPMYCRTADNI